MSQYHGWSKKLLQVPIWFVQLFYLPCPNVDVGKSMLMFIVTLSPWNPN